MIGPDVREIDGPRVVIRLSGLDTRSGNDLSDTLL